MKDELLHYCYRQALGLLRENGRPWIMPTCFFPLSAMRSPNGAVPDC